MSFLIAGLLIGVVSSVPIGMLGAYMINRAVNKGFWAGFSVGLFAALVDALYCCIALFGMSFVVDIPVVRSLVQAIGLLVLLYIGKKHFLSRSDSYHVSTNDEAQPSSTNNNKGLLHLKGFAVVITFALANPTLLAFWVNMAQVLHSSILLNSSGQHYLLFSGSVGIGSALCQYLVLRLVGQVHHTHQKARTIIRWVGAVIFLTTFIYFSYQLIEKL